MCLGQNSAHHAIHYLNAQLGALYENSLGCVKHSGTGLKPLDRVRYDFALAEYHVGASYNTTFIAQEDMMFSAVFYKPRIEFICNHEAILFLRIEQGHFNSEFTKVGSPGLVPDRSKNITLYDTEIAFLMKFDIEGIRGNTTKIGNGTHVVQLLVLDFSSAKLVSHLNAGERQALTSYMKKYLDYLHSAGHHVLFSLPDFADGRLDHTIDYSLESHVNHTLNTEIQDIFGVSVDEINRNLSSKWLKSIMDAENDGDRDAVCLAEYRSTWTSMGDRPGVQFHIKFGAPRVRALCQREVVLYLKVDEIFIYEDHIFTRAAKYTYNDWEMAFVIDLVKDIDASFHRVKLDIATIRFCDHFSKFLGFDASSDVSTTLRTRLIEFVNHYTTVLENAGLHVLHVVDLSRLVTSPRIGGSFAEFQNWGQNDGVVDVRQQDIIAKTDTGGFDFVQVISQQTVIEHFKLLWQSYRDTESEYRRILGKWSHGNDFKASFGPLKISYLSNEKAIIWVQLDEGTLKPPKGSKSLEYSNWSIAFEVKIKIVTHEEVLSSSRSWFIRFIESFAWKKHGNQEYRALVHLALDLNSSEFAYELSKFEGLPLGNRSAVNDVKGIVHHLKRHYLPALIQHGYHILQSIPLWKTGSFPPPLGLTDVTFQTYSKDSVDRQNCQQMSQNQEIVLVLLGMTNFHHPPAARLQYSTQWFVPNKKLISHGTVCLSRKTFLEERLLAHLTHLNGATTIVPTPNVGEKSNDVVSIFNGHQGDALGLLLTTWAQNDLRWGRSGRSQWEPSGGKGNGYKWSHIGRWNHEHKGPFDDKYNGAYMVSCQTENSLNFPTSINSDSLDITIRGEINIGLSFQNNSSDWSFKASGKWETILSMKTKADGSGIAIEASGDTQPEFEITRIQGEANLKELMDLDALRSLIRIDMSGIVEEMKQTFSGVWEHCFPGMRAYSLCSPTFNARGDILFELHPYAGSNHPPIQIISHSRNVSTQSESEAPSASRAHEPTNHHSLTPRKSKSLFRRISEGVTHAGHNVGEAIEGVFQDSNSGDSSSKSRGVSAPAISSVEANSFKSPGRRVFSIATRATSKHSRSGSLGSGTTISEDEH